MLLVPGRCLLVGVRDLADRTSSTAYPQSAARPATRRYRNRMAASKPEEIARMACFSLATIRPMPLAPLVVDAGWTAP
jgi:hypothetical protein